MARNRKKKASEDGMIQIVKMVKSFPISKLHIWERNPRQNDKAVEAVEKSISRFGRVAPIIADEKYRICAGETRYKAAVKAGVKTFPVIVCRFPDEGSFVGYNIADNQTASIAEWEIPGLQALIAELSDTHIELEDIGFTDASLEALIDSMEDIDIEEGKTDPDDIPDPPDNPKTKSGDLYILGDHRLLCGDAGRKEDLDYLLDGAPVHLVNTDPPYNVKVEPRSNNAKCAAAGDMTHHQRFDIKLKGRPKRTTRKLRAKDRPLENDFMSDEEFEKLLKLWFGNIARVLKPGRAFYIWGGYANCGNYPPALKASELYFSQAIIWVKEHPVLTRKDFMGNHEWCFYGWREGAKHWFNPKIKNATDVWGVKKVNPSKMIHLTEKPVELAVRAMVYSSRPGENVLDVFGGSGSTLIAAEQTSRKAFIMEIDPLYCDVIVERWQKFTGKKAKRDRRRSRAKAS